MNHYEILGISESADVEQIKNAYRKLARKYHPDKTGGKESKEFLQATEAYKALMEKERRKKQNNIHVPEKKTSRPKNRGTDLQITISANLEDLAKGVVRNIVTTRKGLCPDCGGSGSKAGRSKPCPLCKGGGGGSFSVSKRKRCGLCDGTGKIPEGGKCTRCLGQGLVPEKINQVVRLSPKTDSRIVVAGSGNCSTSGGYPGDLVVDVQLKPHAVFKKQGLNLIRTLNMSPAQAILGDTVNIDVLGRKETICIPNGAQNGQLVEKEKAGLSYEGYSGNLLVRLKIVIPEGLSKEQKDLYTRLLAIEKGE